MGRPGASNTMEIVAGVPLPDAAGGKALGLRSILDARLAVPRAWVVLPSASEGEIETLARELAAANVDLLAVRSSAADEDGSRCSFAGIHESLLGVAPAGLRAAVRAVAASALSERAIAYRAEMGLAPAAGPCAVVVQVLVPSECAGVAFGLGEANEAVVVEAVEGLGESLVQGAETPESWELALGDGAWLVRRHRPRRQLRVLRAGARRSEAADASGDPATSNVLREEEATRVAEGVRILQAAAGVPLDVEWCVAHGTLYFVQSRPRTRPLGALVPGQTWSRTNYREVLPEIPPALTRSFVSTALRAGMRRYMAPYASLLPRDVPLVECIHGRLIANESASVALLERLGIPRSLVDVTLGGGDGGADRFEPMDLRRQLRHPVVMARALARVLVAPRTARRTIDACRRVRDEVRSLSLAKLADETLLHYAVALPPTLGARFAYTSILVVAALQGARYRALGILRSVPHPGAVIARLVAPGLQTVSSRMTDELVGLAARFRRWPGASAFLADAASRRAGPSSWCDTLPPDLFRPVQEWVDRYGHRGPYESDLASPRYRDDGRLLVDVLRPLVLETKEAESPDARRERLAREANTTWSELRAHLGAAKRWALRSGVRGLRRLLALREQVRSEMIACVYEVRGVLRELGRRLEQRGRLASWDDIWHLDLDQLARAFRDRGFDVAGAVARERGRRAAWRRVEVPNRFRSEDVAGFRDHAGEATVGVTTLRGTGISPGLVEGRARLLETPHDGAALRAGEILVAHVTDPGWTPLFARAAGVLVEMGGTLSHAGIVARECGIPCVANVDGVMRQLRDGQLLSLDGTTGTVRVLDPRNENHET